MNWYKICQNIEKTSLVCKWLSDNPIDLQNLQMHNKLPDKGFKIIKSNNLFSVLFVPANWIVGANEPTVEYAVRRALAWLLLYSESCRSH